MKGNPLTLIGNEVKVGEKAPDFTVLAKALERAGIKDFRFHDLRHTYNTNARKAGVDKTVIMKLTGHKTLSMFTRYNTVDQADAKEAMEKLESYFARRDEPTAAIVLQGQKRGQDESPNPLNLLAPRDNTPKRTFMGWIPA